MTVDDRSAIGGRRFRCLPTSSFLQANTSIYHFDTALSHNTQQSTRPEHSSLFSNSKNWPRERLVRLLVKSQLWSWKYVRVRISQVASNAFLVLRSPGSIHCCPRSGAKLLECQGLRCEGEMRKLLDLTLPDLVAAAQTTIRYGFSTTIACILPVYVFLMLRRRGRK